MFRRIESHSPVKTSHTAEKLETPGSTGLAGGVGPLVDHLAALAGGEAGSRRVRDLRDPQLRSRDVQRMLF